MPCCAIKTAADGLAYASNSRRNRHEKKIFTPRLGKKGMVTI